MTKVVKLTEIEAEKKEKFKKLIVEGEAMYASVHTPKKPYKDGDTPCYTLDLIVDEETASQLKAVGLKVAKVKIDEDTKKPKEYDSHPGMPVFAFRRKITKSDGSPRSAPEVVDSELNPIPKETLIGNGSKVRCSVNYFTYLDEHKKQVTGHLLLGVQVLELVPYEGNTGSGFEKTSGFKVKTKSSMFNDVEDDDTPPFEE